MSFCLMPQCFACGPAAHKVIWFSHLLGVLLRRLNQDQVGMPRRRTKSIVASRGPAVLAYLPTRPRLASTLSEKRPRERKVLGIGTGTCHRNEGSLQIR